MSFAVVSFRAAWRELVARPTPVVLVLGLSCALLFALVERRAAPAFASDRALLGPAFGLMLPLACLVSARALFRRGIQPALSPLAALGVNRRLVLAGRASALLVAAAVIALPLAFGVVAVALPSHSWLAEWSTLPWVAVLAGSSYAALVLLGVSVGRYGAWAFLVLDWLLGSGSGWLALPWPRAHVRSLLGGSDVLGLGQSGSALALLGLLASSLALCWVRTPR